MDIAKELPAPAAALTRAVKLPSTANLTDTTEDFAAKCREYGALGPGKRCFTRERPFTSQGLGLVEYALYDAAENISLTTDNAIDLFFQFDCKFMGYGECTHTRDVSLIRLNIDDSGQEPTPWLGYVVFDPQLTSDFPLAYDCGMVTVQHFPALSRAEINIELRSIDDQVSAIPASMKNDTCNELRRKHPRYRSYHATITSLEQRRKVLNSSSCDLSRDYTGPCTNDLVVKFSSLLHTSYKSSRDYDFVKALTEEGGIVGYVQFFMFFLMLWKD